MLAVVLARQLAKQSAVLRLLNVIDVGRMNGGPKKTNNLVLFKRRRETPLVLHVLAAQTLMLFISKRSRVLI